MVLTVEDGAQVIEVILRETPVGSSKVLFQVRYCRRPGQSAYDLRLAERPGYADLSRRLAVSLR
jgi:hypothetical protein